MTYDRSKRKIQNFGISIRDKKCLYFPILLKILHTSRENKCTHNAFPYQHRLHVLKIIFFLQKNLCVFYIASRM